MLKHLAVKNLKPKSFITLALVALVFLVIPDNVTHALTVGDAVVSPVLSIIGVILTAIVWIFGLLVLVVVSVLIDIAQYNGFITSPPVMVGWVIVRDLCNMFFVLILLVIAFATILRIPNYSIKQLLKRVIIFAILINFSKLICGVLIDFAQVIMLTFVNGFKDAGGGNIIVLLGLDKLLSKGFTDGWDDFWNIIASYFLAVIYIIVMLVVLIALLGTLVYRIIMIWIYVILSPLAYLGAVAPLTQRISSTWWSQFSQALITGPILAFFIWLSLATLGQFSDDRQFLKETGFNVPNETNVPTVGGTEVGTTAHMMRFVVSIGLLIGGLMVAKTFGGAAGGAAATGMAKLQAGAGWAKKTGKRAAVAVTKRPAYAIADKGLGAISRIPLVGSAATRQQAKLRMKRDFAEEKDSRYMSYIPSKSLNRMARMGPIDRLLGKKEKGILMESKRQDYNKAMAEKARRGWRADWGDPRGGSGSDAAKAKTSTGVKLAIGAGAFLNTEGRLAFRDEAKGKVAENLWKSNPGHINEEILREFFSDLNKKGEKKFGVGVFQPNKMGLSKANKGETGVQHYAKQMTGKDLMDLDHNQITPELIKALLPLDASGGVKRNKKMAKWYDDASEEQRIKLDEGAEDSFEVVGGAEYVFGTRAGLGNYGKVGSSFMVKGQTNNPVVASGGIGGLNNIAKGRFSVDFAELNLDQNAIGKYISDPDEKAEVVSRMSGKMRAGGMSEEQVKATADQLNSLSYLLLRNKGQNVDLATSKSAQAHEWSHAKMDQNFTKDERKGIWDSLDEVVKNDAKQKIRATWGSDLPEEEVMDEYFAEGLRGKTRWNKGADVSLGGRAEASMNEILAKKGTSVDNLVENITDTKPLVEPQATPAEVEETISENLSNSVDPELASTIKDLAKVLGGVGNGLAALGSVAKNLDSLNDTVSKNNSYLTSQAKAYKDNTLGMESLSKRIKAKTL